MLTESVAVDPVNPSSDAIACAAAVLRAGGLVAFPTETVYGLGAHALDAAAVARIFTAKGRPAQNPLIVHVPGADAASSLALDWPPNAAQLARQFWPGPLTLVVERAGQVPDIVTAGGSTVAVRVPAHPVALALLHAAGIPLAAPSANRSGNLSSTCAEHVLHGLAGRIDMLLDGGPTPGGLESTVLDVTASPPRLLRPGLVAPAAIAAVIGPIVGADMQQANEPLRSPGMSGRHYAPSTPLECARDSGWERVDDLCRQGLRMGWLTFSSEPAEARPEIVAVVMPTDVAGYAAQLYAALHILDQAGVDRIVVAMLPAGEDWLAIRDRLFRASLNNG